MPVADRVLPIVRALAEGREPDDLLFVTEPATSCTPRRSSERSRWAAVAEGRRIHDLRHTAACLWLARGVDPVTVQAWMGHASIATTNLYLHHLGTSADRAGLDRLNAPGARGGYAGTGERGMTTTKPRPILRRSCRWDGVLVGGAEGIRTPDLLIANETRYQLRHSPADRHPV